MRFGTSVQNGGKDGAVNAGLDLVSGDLVGVIDDDDYFQPNVFQGIANDFAAIADSKDVAGLSYLSTDPAGQVWGKQFPSDHMISDHFECRINMKIWGDKCEFTKGSVIRGDHIRFLETRFRGGFGADVMFLASIATQYRTCYVNTPVLFKNYYENGIGVNWRKRGLQNPELAAAYYTCYLHPRVSLAIRLRYMVAYVAIRRFAGYKLAPPRENLPWKRLLFCLAFIPGLIIGSRWKSYHKAGNYPQARQWMRSGS